MLLLLTVMPGGCAAPPETPDRSPANAAAAGEATRQRFTFARLAMGSRAEITLHAATEAEAAAASSLAFDAIERVEQALSDYRPTSEAMVLMSREPNTFHSVSEELLDVLLDSRDVVRASDGAFDPTIGPVTVLWREARRTGRRPDPESLRSAVDVVGFWRIGISQRQKAVRFVRSGMRLDFGGIGKGGGADAALASLRAQGHGDALVSLGGDLAIGDAPPGEPGWVVRLETGLGRFATLTLSNVGVATSGDAEQHTIIDGVRYSHLIDPRTGEPVSEPRAVSVIAPEAWRADAVASALSVLDPSGAERLLASQPGVRAWIWHPAAD